MLIKEEESDKRLNNPLNLINRLKSGMSPIAKKGNNAMSLFKPQGVDPSLISPSLVTPIYPPITPLVIDSTEDKPVSSDDLLDDADSKIKLALAHDDALGLLTASIASLKGKVEANEVKASSLPAIIGSASKVVSEIRRERLEREKTNKGQDVHLHFYCPTQRKVDDYQVIDV